LKDNSLKRKSYQLENLWNPSAKRIAFSTTSDNTNNNNNNNKCLCPVCNEHIPQHLINDHLDSCLKNKKKKKNQKKN